MHWERVPFSFDSLYILTPNYPFTEIPGVRGLVKMTYFSCCLVEWQGPRKVSRRVSETRGS